MNEEKLDFNDIEVAFADKTNADLQRMYFLFSTMNHPLIVKTGIWLTLVSLRLRLPIKAIIKTTIFKQFCGGESLVDSHDTVQKLSASYIKTILDHSAEGEESEAVFDANQDEVLRSLELAKGAKDIPTGVMKLTGFTSFDLLAKKHKREALSDEESSRWAAFEVRVETVCQRAVEHKKFMYIDAEETWIQDPVDELVYKMMAKFNKEHAYIFNTYQMYRVDSLQKLKEAHSKGQKEGYKVGAKLVRGAYMETERERADQMGYPDPIQPDKKATDTDFDAAVKYCIDHIDEVYLCAGTHNEESACLVTKLMAAHQLDKKDPRVYLAQLYGMSDNISYVLAKAGYNVAKYVPYGPIGKVLPYLMRRAEENSSIAGQSGREFLMVQKERARRKTLR